MTTSTDSGGLKNTSDAVEEQDGSADIALSQRTVCDSADDFAFWVRTSPVNGSRYLKPLFLKT